jgi:hypothetical protein
MILGSEHEEYFLLGCQHPVFLTQETAVDLHNVGRFPNTRDDSRGGRGEHIDPVKNISLYHCMAQFFLNIGSHLLCVF